jgi:thiosulfate dehydrogenase [quinone] large subunit
MTHPSARRLLAALQAIIGWEWLMSGGNKLLSGTFPQGLASTISSMLKDNPDGWYVSFLQHTILPQSVFYGYLIEWTELAIGLILLSNALLLLGQPRSLGQPLARLMVLSSLAVIGAALAGAFMTINFHFLAGGWIFPRFDRTAAYGEGIDLDALLPPFEVVMIIAQSALIAEVTGVSWSQRLRRVSQHLLPGNQHASPLQGPLADPVVK